MSSKDDDTETVAISDMTYAEVMGVGTLLKQGYLLKRPSRHGSFNLGLTKQRFIVLQTDRLLWFKKGEAQDCILGEIPISPQTEITRHAANLISSDKVTVKTGDKELDLMASKVGELDEWVTLIQEQVAILRAALDAGGRPHQSVTQRVLARCANGSLLRRLGRSASDRVRRLCLGCSTCEAGLVVAACFAAILWAHRLRGCLLAVLACWVLPLLMMSRSKRNTTASIIAECMRSAEEAGREPPVSAAPPLSSGRVARVAKLFLLFSPSTGLSIDATDLAQVVVTQGPRESKVLAGLQSMDADGDGRLTFSEMTRFFAVAGAKMSDDEFGFLVDDMVATCQSAIRAKLAVAAHS